jgi:hypothetical protein
MIGSARDPLGNVATSLPDQPLPFAADIHDGQIARAKCGAFDWKAAVLEMGEPGSRPHWSIIAKVAHVQHLKRPFSRGSCQSRRHHLRAARDRPSLSSLGSGHHHFDIAAAALWHTSRRRHSGTGVSGPYQRACSVGSSSLR